MMIAANVARRRIVSPDQRFLGVLDTSPFRIAIVYSIVFACGAAVLLGAVDFAVSRVVDGSTDNLIEAEVQGLREQVLVLSRSDFIDLIEQRSQDQDVRVPDGRPAIAAGRRQCAGVAQDRCQRGQVDPVQGVRAVRR
jgi:hypothetical protein